MYEIKKNLNDIFIHFIVKNVFKCDIYGLNFSVCGRIKALEIQYVVSLVEN